ncbi:MAG: c-type cytochrome domain-containing protein [Bacteroidota bacterium]
MRLKILFLLALIGAICFLYKQETRIDFNMQVKPLLNRKCMRCHGGVKQNGDFSLLTREEALKPTKNGKLAIVPGHPEASEMIRRLQRN